MKRKIAIQGHTIRGTEVIKALEEMGGKKTSDATGHDPDAFYYIDEGGCIVYDQFEELYKDFKLTTLGDYLATLPIADRLTLPQGHDEMEVIIPEDCELVNEGGKWVMRRKENVHWIARDKDGGLYIYACKPTLVEERGVWHSNKIYQDLDNSFFPEVTFENSPQKVKPIMNED